MTDTDSKSRVTNVSADEHRVVELVLEGIEQGRNVYGPLDLKTDGRNFIREALEECRDMTIYLCAALARLERMG